MYSYRNFLAVAIFAAVPLRGHAVGHNDSLGNAEDADGFYTQLTLTF